MPAMATPPTSAGTTPVRRLSYIRLSAARPATRNPKTHNTRQVAALIARHGLIDLPTADSRTDRIVHGHGRIKALVELRAEGAPPPQGVLVDDDGEWLIPVVEGWQSSSDLQAEAAAIGLNKATIDGAWDAAGLCEVLDDIQAADAELFEILEFSADDLDALLRLADPDRCATAQDATGEADDEDDNEDQAADTSATTDDTEADDEDDNEDRVPLVLQCPHCGETFSPGR